MGVANFYIKIYCVDDKQKNFQFDVQRDFSNLIITERNKDYICFEAIIDNMLISSQIIFNLIIKHYKLNDIITVETYGEKQDICISNFMNFLSFVYNSNKDKFDAYYQEFGGILFNPDNYYKNRKKYSKNIFKINFE